MNYNTQTKWILAFIMFFGFFFAVRAQSAQPIENFPLHFRLAAEICRASNGDNLQCEKTPFEDDDILQLKEYVPGQMLRGNLIKTLEIPCGTNDIQFVSAEIIIDKVWQDKKSYHLTLVIKNKLNNPDKKSDYLLANNQLNDYRLNINGVDDKSTLDNSPAENFPMVFQHSFSEPSQFPRLTFDSEICYLKNGFSSYQVKISPPWRASTNKAH